jgi:hypothetical protein
MRFTLWFVLSAVAGAEGAGTPQALVPAPQLAAAAPTQAARPTGSKVWIGRYADFEDFLKTAKIERFEDTKVGVTLPKHCFFTPGGLAAGAICKNLPPGYSDGLFESYKSEIAAYKLDRLLQLDMVPPTVERRVNGALQSVQLWVENVLTVKEVLERKLQPAPADANQWDREFYRQRVFDDLVGNIDSNQGNLLFDRAWNRILVDFSRAFTDTREQPYPLTRIDRSFLNRIKSLDRDTLRREIGDLLPSGGLGALLLRRDDIVKAFERLVKEKGESQVFLP